MVHLFRSHSRPVFFTVSPASHPCLRELIYLEKEQKEALWTTFRETFCYFRVLTFLALGIPRGNAPASSQ